MKFSDSSPRLYLIPVLCLFSLFHGEAGAQNVALKTNLPYAAAASANLGIEVGLAPRWTLDISGNYMPWKFYNGLLRKHAFVQPEARYWFCDRFSGHFIGVHAHSGLFNVTGSGVLADVPLINKVFDDLDQRRYQGWFAGAGLSYGYAFILGKHWNLELEGGVGYSYIDNDVYECEECGTLLENRHNHYVGLTKAALNIVYVF